MEAQALGALLRRRREAIGASQQDVADAAGIRWQPEVSLAERGKGTKPNAQRVRRGLVRLERAAGAGKRLAWPYAPREPVPALDERAVASMAAAGAIPRSPERDAYFCLLIYRAWDCLDAGDAESADLLCEFLPDRVRVALIDQFFTTEDPRPRWALDQLFNGAP